MPPAPEVTTEEWESMANAATQPGIHFRSQGFRERLGFMAGNLKDKKILGRPLYEVIADFGAGFAVKTAVRSGVMLAGASTLGAVGAAVLAGAASGAVFAGGKEWFRQARENWQEALPPEAVTTRQQILERLNDLTPNDWKRLGGVTIRGAVVGAAFGMVGAIASEAFHAATSAGGEGVGSAPVTEPSSASPDTSENVIPDHTTATMPEPPIHAAPVVDTGAIMPEGVPVPSTDIPLAQPTEIPSTPSTDVTSTPTEPSTAPLPADSSTIPPPAETTTPTHIATPLTPEEPAVSPTSTTTPAPDTVAPAQPDTPPAQPTEIPSTPSTDVTSTPTEPSTAPLPADSSAPIPTETTAAPATTELSSAPPIDAVSENVSNLKDIPLAAGSNPWQVATEILKQVDPDHVPSNQEIMQVTRAICEQNDISVPEWGINGSVDTHQIPIGYLLKIDPEVKSVITDIVKGGK